MDQKTAEAAILTAIHYRTKDAARIAKAAQACAEASSINEAITISMEIEQLLYEAGRLQDAASLLNRLAQQR